MAEDRSQHWLTIEEVAQELKVHPETVRRYIRAKALKAVKFGNRGGYRIREQDLQMFIEGKQKEQAA